MIKALSRRFQQCLGLFYRLTVEGFSETGLLNIKLYTSLTISNFGNTYALRLISFFKMFKFSCGFENCSKNLRKNVLFFR